jgi:hypothetical protein
MSLRSEQVLCHGVAPVALYISRLTDLYLAQPKETVAFSTAVHCAACVYGTEKIRAGYISLGEIRFL